MGYMVMIDSCQLKKDSLLILNIPDVAKWYFSYPDDNRRLMASEILQMLLLSITLDEICSWLDALEFDQDETYSVPDGDYFNYYLQMAGEAEHLILKYNHEVSLVSDWHCEVTNDSSDMCGLRLDFIDEDTIAVRMDFDYTFQEIGVL